MIKTILKNLSPRPGIYKMFDINNRIIYIGKATNLKKRVSSYFTSNNKAIKTNKLIEKIKNIEVVITTNEQEALILENTLIKKHRPRYNILLRDDKSYPYIFIDTEHDFPLFKFYRGDKKALGKYFGPYTQANTLRRTLSIIQKTFKVRQCENSYFKSRKKPCLQYQIERCTAPCVKFITKEDYKESVDNSILFLQGKSEPIIKNYIKKMNTLSNDRRYEEASQVRDKIATIRRMTQNQNIIFEKGNMDIITIATLNDKVCIDVFMTRDSINLGNQPFKFPNKELISEDVLLNSFIKQYYLKNLPPEKVLLASKTSDCFLLEKVLEKKYGKKVKITKPNKKIYNSYIKICQENTNSRVKQFYLSTSNINMFDVLSKDLSWKKNIKKVVCFDVSHISGSNAVGSSVWFDTKGPDKSLYRRYNLEKTPRSDDYKAIYFIIKKRLQTLIKEKRLPNLILIDGGKGHISKIKSLIKEMTIKSIFILGIAKGDKRHFKNDRIFDINNNDVTKKLSRGALQVLQNIRNEAHRFAIIGQRKKIQKKQFDSKLDGIPGIGKNRKLDILKFFGGIQGVLKSSTEDLTRVPNISDKLATIIYHHLHK